MGYGCEEAWKVIDNTQLPPITDRLLDDGKSTITHERLSDEQHTAACIKEGLIRLAVRLEDAKDLIGDLERGWGEGIDWAQLIPQN